MTSPYRTHTALTNAMPHALCLCRPLQCIVFNCSEQIDHTMPARLFSGLVQTGAWTCLDEFNRINIEVLSVIAEQVIYICCQSHGAGFLFWRSTLTPRFDKDLRI